MNINTFKILLFISLFAFNLNGEAQINWTNDGDSYFKLVDETHEVICVTTNFTNKCVAMSIDNTGGYEGMRDMYMEPAPGIELISEELFEARKDEVKLYITENL